MTKHAFGNHRFAGPRRPIQQYLAPWLPHPCLLMRLRCKTHAVLNLRRVLGAAWVRRLLLEAPVWLHQHQRYRRIGCGSWFLNASGFAGWPAVFLLLLLIDDVDLAHYVRVMLQVVGLQLFL